MTSIHRLATGLCLLLATTALSAARAAPGVPTYSISDHWVLGGTGGWDYLLADGARHRLFLSRGDHVDVVDTDTGKVTATIAATAGVHGIALAPDLGHGWTSNGRANSVTEFDYNTLAVTREVPVPGQNPDAILYDPASEHLFTFNGRSKDATVLDAHTLAVVATLPMPDKPEFAATDGHGHVYVNIESEPGRIVVIDSKRLRVTATWTLGGCNSPTGLALDARHARLFSVCDDKVMAVTDSHNGHAIARIAIGDGPDATAYDAARGLVFSSNGEGTLTVIHQDSADHYTVVATVPTQRGARTMALDAGSGRVYLVSADFGPAPAATAEQPHPRPAVIPGTFTVLVGTAH